MVSQVVNLCFGLLFQGKTNAKPKNHQQKWWGIVLSLGRHPDIQVSDVSDFLATKADKFVFQKERGEAGTDHYQCAVHFIKKQTKKPIIAWLADGLFGGAEEAVSVEAAKAVPDLLRYCTKADTRISDDYFCYGMAPERLLGTKDVVADMFDLSIATMWQAFLLSHCGGVVPRNHREIIWVVDRVGGSGKSSLCRHLALKRHFCILDSTKKADVGYAAGARWMGYVFDLARCQRVSSDFYSGAESLKNGFIFSSKYESAQKIFNQPWVFVFANFLPVGTAWSLDRCSLIDIDNDPRWSEPASEGFRVEYDDGNKHSSVSYNRSTGTGRITREPYVRPIPKPPAALPSLFDGGLGFTVDSSPAEPPLSPEYRCIRIVANAGDST